MNFSITPQRFTVSISLLFLVLLSLGALPSVMHAAEVELNANYLEYDEDESFVNAQGSVTVNWQDKTLQADKVKFWVDKKYLLAEGNVSLKEGNNVLFGQTIAYDYKTATGEICPMAGYSNPWFFYSKKAERKSEKEYHADNIVATTCELEKPHYTFRARKAKIVLEKRITVYDPVLYIRNIPVFYLPIYTQALGSKRNSLEIQPGYNSEDGVIIKMIYGYPLGASTYGKLFLDYYSRRGWGKGAELDYNVPDKIKGTLYGYHIKEDTTGNERWSVRASHWQKLDPLWTTQSEIDFLSDTTFNNLYMLENWQRVNQQLHSYITFTRQSSRSNLRILTERYDTFNPFSGAFEAQNITIPRLTYTLYPKRNKYFYTNFNTTLQNQYLGSLDYYLISGNADSNITFDRRLRKNITFTPTFGITETWQDRTSSIDLNDIFVTQYYSNLNLRYRPTRSMDWDFRYNYRLRSKMNSLLPDSNADDYGEVTNQVTFFNSLYISMEVVMRNSIGYNFRKLRSENIDSWMRKFNPQVNEFTWTPRMPFYVYLRQENDIYPYSFRALQVDSRVGNPDIRYLNLGVFYQSARPDQLDFITGIGFWPTKKWRIDYVIRPRTLNNFREVQVNDQELKLFRDLHCWEFKLTYRRRGTAEEFFVLLDLMSAARNREKLYEPRQEREFYPWRYPDLSY